MARLTNLTEPSRDWRAYSMAAEATVELICAAIAVRILSFKSLVTGVVRSPTGISSGTDKVKIVQAIDRATRRIPWAMKCFPRAIAAHRMLGRRGHATQLVYGAVARPFLAHVWLEDGEGIVIGADAAGDCGELARFPPVLLDASDSAD